MKWIYNFFFLVTLSVNAQLNNEPVKLAHYVLDSFAAGKVLLKSGVTSNQQLNYNLVTNEMIFNNKGTYLAIANPENVDTVFMAGRRFIPVGNSFYEFLGGTANPLFVEHTCTIKEEGTPTGFGNTTTTAATPLRSLMKDNLAYQLKLPDGYEVIPKHTYYIYKNGQYNKVNNEQQWIHLFPAKKDAIKTFVKNSNISFSKQADLLLLLKTLE
ncbi:MAG: hypothetical protein QM802_11000 [Agriterribacter sp.]